MPVICAFSLDSRVEENRSVFQGKDKCFYPNCYGIMEEVVSSGSCSGSGRSYSGSTGSEFSVIGSNQKKNLK